MTACMEIYRHRMTVHFEKYEKYEALRRAKKDTTKEKKHEDSMNRLCDEYMRYVIYALHQIYRSSWALKGE